MRYSQDLWDGFRLVYDRTTVGREFLKKVENWFKKREELEREYSKKLLALTKSPEADFWSVQSAWASLKAETAIIAQKHEDFANAIKDVVEAPIHNFVRSTRKEREKANENGIALLKQIKEAEAKLASKKKSFEDFRKKQDELKSEHERATFNNHQTKEVEKIAKRLKDISKKVASADTSYSNAVNNLSSTQRKVWDEDMPVVLDQLQRIEEDRINCLRSTLAEYGNVQSNLGPEISSCGQRVTTGANAINASSDVDAFCAEKKTGSAKPPKAEYEPYNSTLGKCCKEGEGPPQSVTSPARASTFIAAPPPSTPAPTPPTNHQPISQAKALYDYDATDPNELSFKAGDIIKVYEKDASGWWQGELNGRKGVFPSVDWVEEIPAAGSSNFGGRAPSIKRTVTALYDFSGQLSDELSFIYGANFTVDKEEDGWLWGTNENGVYGKIPASYVQDH